MKFDKRSKILAVIAVILLALLSLVAPVFIPVVIVLVLGCYIWDRFFWSRDSKEPLTTTYSSVEEVKMKYGEPDDVVVLDASRVNELSALVLFYTERDLMLVAGEELKISDMESVMPKNMATPYTVDEYAVIISTKNPQRPTVYLRVGYDNGLAGEIAAQIDAHRVSSNA